MLWLVGPPRDVWQHEWFLHTDQLPARCRIPTVAVEGLKGAGRIVLRPDSSYTTAIDRHVASIFVYSMRCLVPLTSHLARLLPGGALAPHFLRLFPP